MELHAFVICAYGESKYLEECIQSLLCQTIKSRILIATSTPNEFINELGRRYRLEVYINRDGRGIADDWNFAYAQADSKYVTLAHQDDIYEPTPMRARRLRKYRIIKRGVVAFGNAICCPAVT